MLHHLVPDEVAPGSLDANLDFYEPRTAHGSSLSPAIHAGLFARAGRPDDALPALRIASLIDLQDLTGTTAGGLHLATMGGLWQALVFGFLGARPRDGVLELAPRLPRPWEALDVSLAFRGRRVHVHATHGHVAIDADEGARVAVGGQEGRRFAADGERWKEVGQ
jgi:trehalose/maltose hydrolase-like predicted phosphorylase